MANGGYVKRLIRHPCAADGSIAIYAEAAITVGVASVWQLLAPGCSGIATARLGKPDFGHRRFKAIFHNAVEDKKSGPGRHLWPAVIAPARAVLWYWLVAETLVDASVNWTTIVYSELKCELPSSNRADIPILPWALTPFSSSLIPFGGPTHRLCVDVDFMHIWLKLGCQVTLTYEIEWKMTDANGYPGDNVTTKLMVDDVQTDGESTTSAQGASPNNTTLGSGWRISGGTQPQGKQISILATHGGAYWDLVRGSVSMTLSGHEVPFFTLPNCFSKKSTPLFRTEAGL
jgi:hypothetical protein